MLITAALFLAALFVAYANGANDNFKGVATLYGSGTATYKSAVALATVATLAGSLSSVYFAAAMAQAFSGVNTLVILASRFGLPVSTTHVSVGAISGIGLANGSARKDVISGILAAWLLTLPVAAILGALLYALRGFFPLS